MLGCTIVLTLGLTAHAQSFDPLYKPELGDTVMVGWPDSYGIPIGVGGMRAKLSFFGTIGVESPEMVWDMNKVSGHMEDGHTYLLKQGKRYRLHAGLKVKIIAKTRTVATLFNAQIVQAPLYEVEIAEGEFTGIHVYISGFDLQQKARHLQDDWDQSDGVMHTGLVLEDDNPKLAIAQYRFAYSLSSNTYVLAAAKKKLLEAGVPLPPTMAEAMAKMEETKDKDDAEP